MHKKLKNFFKVSIKGLTDAKQPTIKEVTYKGADGQDYVGLEFEGYASTKHPDRGYDIVEPQAFQKTLNEFMTNPQIFLQHNKNKPVGSITEASVDDVGLYVKGLVKVDTDNIFQKLRTGVIRTMSFGYSVNEYERVVKEDSKGKKQTYAVIKDLNLYEVSLVSVPMNPAAKLKSADDVPTGLSDAEYKEFFDVEKNDEFPLHKSLDIAIAKDEEGEANEDVEVPGEDDEVETPTEDVVVEDENTDDANPVSEDDKQDDPEAPVEDAEKKDTEDVVTDDVEEEVTTEETVEETVENVDIPEDAEEAVVEETEETTHAETDNEPEQDVEKSLDIMRAKANSVGAKKKILDIETEIKFMEVPTQYASKVPQGAMYFEGIVSDDGVDRYDTRVLPSAFKGELKKFVKNGVVLLSHDSNNPIGLPLRAKVNEANQVEVGGYIYDEYTDNKASKGLFRGLSIGFIPLDWMREDKETGDMITKEEFDDKMSKVETRKEFVTLLDSYRFVVTKLDWLEYSFVTTPANKGTSIKLEYVGDSIKEKYAVEIKEKQLETERSGNATSPEIMDQKAMADKICELEKQLNDYDAANKTLAEENAELKSQNLEKDSLVLDAMDVVNQLTKQVDDLNNVVETQEVIIAKARKVWTKNGKAFVQKSQDPNAQILNELEKIQQQVRAV